MSTQNITHSNCFHCGQPNPSQQRFQVKIGEKMENACCVGCQTVAQAIVDQGLGAYYQQRKADGNKINPVPEEVLQQLSLFDDREIQASFVVAHGDEQEASLILEGITCAACIWLSEQTIRRLPGVSFVNINYGNARALVRWQPEKIQLSKILEAIRQIGYSAYPFDTSKQQSIQIKERKNALKRLFVAGFGMMQVMMYAWPAYFATAIDLPLDQDMLLKWASLILTVPVVIYSAWPFYKGTWRDLRAKQIGMDVPVTLGILGAFIPSVWATLIKQGHVYFDSVTMFVFLLLLGRFFEQMARQKASENTDRLSKLLPTFAHLLTDWPNSQTTKEEAVSRLSPGQYLLIKPGETSPVDGKLVQGESQFIESLLTGESHPQAKQVGDSVIAGSINQEHPIILQATEVGANTKLSAIVRLLDHAVASKPQIAEVANQFASWFVLFILLTAMGAAYFWHLHAPEKALWITVSVLVITCPCALSLAVPVTLTAATGRFASLQLLVSKSHAISTFANITDIVFDKTGTLTTGQLNIAKIAYFAEAEDCNSIIHTLENQSEHPIALALCKDSRISTGKLLPVDEIQNIRGQGLEAKIKGTTYRLGNAEFLQAFNPLPIPNNSSTNVSPIYLGTADRWLAAIYLEDELKSDAQALINALKQAHLNIHIASGDQSTNVARVANLLDISEWHANCKPEDKLALIDNLQAKQKVVCMVGDGVNDAPVLGKAQLSIAVDSGADIAQQAADVILADYRLMPIYTGLQIAHKTKQVIRQNLAWGIAYNLIAIPLAVTGHVTPLIAGVGMASSSLIVVLNSLRLTK